MVEALAEKDIKVDDLADKNQAEDTKPKLETDTGISPEIEDKIAAYYAN